MKNKGYDGENVCVLRVGAILRERGLSNSWLGDRLGVSATVVSSICNHHTTVSVRRLTDIAKILRVDVGDLFDDTHWYYDANEEDKDYSTVERCPDDLVFRGSMDEYGSLKYADYDLCISELTESEHRRLSYGLGMSRKEMTMVLRGNRYVTPVQWMAMVNILKEKAFLVLPKVKVIVSKHIVHCFSPEGKYITYWRTNDDRLIEYKDYPDGDFDIPEEDMDDVLGKTE